MLAEQGLQLAQPLRSGRVHRQLHFHPRRLGRADVGEPRDLVHLDLRRRLGSRLLLRLRAELLRQPHRSAHQQRVVRLEQLLESLQHVLVEHQVAGTGQILEHGEGDLLAGLRQPLAVAGDDAGHCHLFEPFRIRQRGAGVRRIALHVVHVPRQWMAGDVEAERLLLLGQAVALSPFFLAEDPFFASSWLARLRTPEQPELSGLAILLRSGPLRQRRLDCVPQRLARLAGEVERTGGHQSLQSLAIDLLGVDARAEVEDAGERPRARREDGLDRVLAHPLDGAQPETDQLLARLLRIRAHAERQLGIVHVRRQHGEAVGARLGDVRDHLVGIVLLRGEQRGHELDRMVRLQPGRLIRDQSIRGGMALVERVGRELLHRIEELGRELHVDAVPGAALDEAAALLRHEVGLLLPHRAAEQIGAAERIPAQHLRDLHHLLLVDDHPVGVAQDGLEARVRVADTLAPVLAVDEDVHHARVERARAVERARGDDVLEHAWL